MEVIDVRCGGARPQRRYRQVAQPDDLLDQLARGIIFAGQMALVIINIARGHAVHGFADTLAERIITVAYDLPRGGSADTPAFGVITVAEGTVADQVACRIVAVVDNLSAGCLLQPVAAQIDAGYFSAAVKHLGCAVAARIIGIVEGVIDRLALVSGDEPIQTVVAMVLIGAAINSVAQVGDAPSRIVTDRARFGQLALWIKPQVDDIRAA